ncbi:MAG TPA: GGDEF domain-containing protein [Iamia sp.]|nr:GGDEF domain-containing protein [Iamia sp.]
MRTARTPDGRPTHHKVVVIGVFLLALLAVVGSVAAISVRSVERDLRVIAQDEGAMLVELRDIHHLVLRAQLALEQAATASSDERARIVDRFDGLLDEALTRWDAAADHPLARRMPETAAAVDRWAATASVLREDVATGDGVDLALVRSAFEDLSTAFEASTVPLTQRVEQKADDALARADLARRILIAVAALGLAVGAIVIRSTFRSSRQQHHEIARRDRERDRDTARAQLETRLARAFDQARTEPAALRVAERALGELEPDRPTELLLADSSRAHVEVRLRTHREEGLPGCGVPSPADCPAASRGQTMVFETSDHFDACPHLDGRPDGPLSAVCVPVSIGGSAEGVLHSTGPDGQVADPETLHRLRTVAARTGDRVGVLRAFSRSEVQASTDPLTGLLNRRSFEDQVHHLMGHGRLVAVCFGDLDHFKAINDTHGHDTGDRALRTFAQTFRTAVRPSDLVARWGGEEFVAAFPDTDAATAEEILGRLQVQLAPAIATAGLPHFTVSFGVADRADGDDLATLVTAADGALLVAKRTGRNRIVLASRRRPVAVRSDSGG